MNHDKFGRLQASFAIVRDSITILGYLADKKLKGIPISKEEHDAIREHYELIIKRSHQRQNPMGASAIPSLEHGRQAPYNRI